MIIVSKQELIDFVKSQPADRRLNMFHSTSEGGCACIMVDYGKEVLNFEHCFACGAHNWVYCGSAIAVIEDKTHISFITPPNWFKIKNYGDVQEFLNQATV